VNILSVSGQEFISIEATPRSNMAPSATLPVDSHPATNGFASKNGRGEALKKTGALDTTFEFEDLTPSNGREYKANIVEDLLDAPNADDLLRDLAVTSKPISIVLIR
jgi:hypothetical protein